MPKSWFMLLTVGLLLLGACSSSAPYRVTASKQEVANNVTWQRDRGNWVITVPGEPGFGEVNVRPLSKALATRPTLVVHLPLQGLEEIKVSYGDRTLTAGIGRQGEYQQAQCDSCSEEELAQLKLLLLSRVKGDGYEIYLPSDYWQRDRGEIKITWIDFFR